MFIIKDNIQYYLKELELHRLMKTLHFLELLWGVYVVTYLGTTF